MKGRFFASGKRLLMPRSLRYQLLSRSLLILSALLLLIGIFQYYLMEQFIFMNKASSMQSQVHLIPRGAWQAIGDTHDPNTIAKVLSTLRAPDTKVAFVDLQGNFYDVFPDFQNSQAPLLSAQDYADAFQSGKRRPGYRIVTDAHGDQDLVVLQPVGSPNDPIGLVEVSTNVGMLKVVIVQQLLIFIVLSLGALVLGLLTFVPILRKTLVPLSRMIDTVKRINAGNLNERLPTDHVQMEIEQLSFSFNDMLERLQIAFASEQEAREKMRRFVADASHELRTPLTSIHGFLEVLLRGAAENPEQLRKALRSMYGESGRLNKLVQDLLFLARQDREPALQLTEGRLDLVLHDMEPQLRLLAGERTVQFAVEDQVCAAFDKDRIKQVVLNLFQNAVQHTDSSLGNIRVTLLEQVDGVTLEVGDNGVGIAEEHLSQLFERFYRVDTARARKHGGAGLGLAITKAIVEQHGGTIACQSQLGSGTTFHVWLPKVQTREKEGRVPEE